MCLPNERRRASAHLVLALLLAVATTANGQAVQQPASLATEGGAGPGSSTDDPPEGQGETEEDDGEDDVLDMDLDDLVDTQVNTAALGDSMLDEVVTSVSRTETSVRRTASAVYVVTSEMIRESGATNLMEVLRTVPGVHVARIDSGSWAISIRGGSRFFANKLLVQIDGRAVYTPTFGGVIWDLHAVPLKDIEAIEVIRGPGGSVWGSNAVNGVINIITKKTADTTGAYAEVGGGDEHRFFTTGRVGGSLGGDLTYRLYGTQLEDDAGFGVVGPPIDGRSSTQSGFRLDWTPNASDTLTLQGDFHNGAVALEAEQTDARSAANFLGRWTRQIDRNSDLSVQLYYDSYQVGVSTGASPFYHGADIFDLDTSYHVASERHDVVCGFGFRNNATYFHADPPDSVVTPESDTFDTISYFVQDTVALSGDLAYLTLGSKFEHNDFVGFVYQPAIKLAVTPSPRSSLWASVARSVRTPTVLDRDLAVDIPVGGGAFLRINDSRSLDVEQALTYEIGMRRQPAEAFYWDLAGYYTRYDDIAERVVVTPGFPYTEVIADNVSTIDSYGFELWSTLELAEWWRLRGSFSFHREDYDIGGAPVVTPFLVTGTYPGNMAYLASSMDLTPRLGSYLALRYVDSIDISTQNAKVPGYLEMDARLSCRCNNGMEVAVVGRNLLDRAHREFFPESGRADYSEVERSVQAVVSWEY